MSALVKPFVTVLGATSPDLVIRVTINDPRTSPGDPDSDRVALPANLHDVGRLVAVVDELLERNK